MLNILRTCCLQFWQRINKNSRIRWNRQNGKSEGNGLFLADDEAVIRKKIMRAVTDAGPTEPNSPMPEVIANLFTIMDIVSTPDTVKFFKDKYASCEIRYGDLKKQLAEDVVKLIAPINARIKDIDSTANILAKLQKLGAEKSSRKCC
jgi:tryptophanyl-tRNA synthetase